MTTDKVAVSQADREAAKAYFNGAVSLPQFLANYAAQARLAGKREGREETAQFVREWNGSTADGNTFFIADALDEIAAALRTRSENHHG